MICYGCYRQLWGAPVTVKVARFTVTPATVKVDRFTVCYCRQCIERCQQVGQWCDLHGPTLGVCDECEIDPRPDTLGRPTMADPRLKKRTPKEALAYADGVQAGLRIAAEAIEKAAKLQTIARNMLAEGLPPETKWSSDG